MGGLARAAIKICALYAKSFGFPSLCPWHYQPKNGHTIGMTTREMMKQTTISPVPHFT